MKLTRRNFVKANAVAATAAVAGLPVTSELAQAAARAAIPR